MNILVINCGSSSLKYQLINSASEAVLAKGLCERIGIEGSQITYQPAGGEKEVTVSPMPVSYTHLVSLTGRWPPGQVPGRTGAGFPEECASWPQASVLHMETGPLPRMAPRL